MKQTNKQLQLLTRLMSDTPGLQGLLKEAHDETHAVEILKNAARESGFVIDETSLGNWIKNISTESDALSEQQLDAIAAGLRPRAIPLA